MIKFTQIPDKLKYPPALKAKLSTYHSKIIEYAYSYYHGRYTQRRTLVTALNIVSYKLVSGDTDDFSIDDVIRLAGAEERPDDATMQDALGSLFLTERNLDWDITPTQTESSENIVDSEPKFVPIVTVPQATVTATTELTPKEDLYIQPPTVPRFSPYPVKLKTIGTTTYCIYPSEPEIPVKQNQISVTTDVNKMTATDLLRLYPKQVIHTRPAAMYNPIPGLAYDEDLGVILKINGFTDDQVRQNIIKYPHLYKLQKLIDGQPSVFYTTIELDGELHNIADAWNLLLDTKLIPYTADFVKEYVVRRYLIERDGGVKHKYPLVGYLDPFLTLFAPPAKYVEWGYSDVVDNARRCVESRVRYKQSRNPVLRRLNDE